MSGIRLIVGLANPGKSYQNTRHNVGAWFVSGLASQLQVSLQPNSKFHGLAASVVINGQKCHLLEPTTYMNESGRAVQAIMQFYKLKPEQVLVVHDELDFDPGVIRLKSDGGHGGHNGLRDIITKIGKANFQRLRIGIGHPGDRSRVTGYVLGEPNSADRQHIEAAIDDGLRVIDELVAGDYNRVMDKLHR
jgi:PTH1 family peptidyl-tRNA hydrolase